MSWNQLHSEPLIAPPAIASSVGLQRLTDLCLTCRFPGPFDSGEMPLSLRVQISSSRPVYWCASTSKSPSERGTYACYRAQQCRDEFSGSLRKPFATSLFASRCSSFSKEGFNCPITFLAYRNAFVGVEEKLPFVGRLVTLFRRTGRSRRNQPIAAH